MTESKKKTCFALFAFFLPVIFLGFYFVFRGIAPFGDSTFLIHDMKAQYVDFFSYMGTVIRGENDFSYSLSRGLGGDYRSFFAYYLVNPLNLIPILMPEKYTPAAISIELTLTFAITSLSCYCTLQSMTRGRNKLFLLFLSLAYSFSGWMLLNAENFQFISEAAILPPVILYVSKMKEDGKKWPAVLFLTASIVLNFYIGYMICLFSALWLILPDGNKFKWKYLLIFPAVLLLSLPVWFPVVRDIGHTMKEADPNWYRPVLNCSLLEFMKKFFPGQFDSLQYRDNGLPAVYCSIVTVFYGLSFFISETNRKKRTHRLILCIILFASFLFRPLTLLWHGFSWPHWWPYRFSFIFIFLLVLMAAESRLRVFLPILLFGVIGLIFNMDRTFSIKLANNQSSSAYNDEITRKHKLLSEIPENPDLFRIEDLYPRSDNDAMHFAYMGITHFDSLADRNTMEFLNKLGFHQDRYTLEYGMGNTAFANALLGVRHIFDVDQTISAEIPSGIALKVPSETALPLPESNDPLEFQSDLAKILGAVSPIFLPIEPELSSISNIECSDEFCWITDPEIDGILEYNLSSDYDGYIYAISGDINQIGDFSIRIKDKSLPLKSREVFIPLGQVQAGIPFQFNMLIDSPVFDRPAVKFIIERKDKLNDLFQPMITGVRSSKISSSNILLNVDPSDEPQRILLTIPYSDRWKAYAGEELLLIDNIWSTFISLTIPPGVTECKLQYR